MGSTRPLPALARLPTTQESTKTCRPESCARTARAAGSTEPPYKLASRLTPRPRGLPSRRPAPAPRGPRTQYRRRAHPTRFVVANAFAYINIPTRTSRSRVDVDGRSGAGAAGRGSEPVAALKNASLGLGNLGGCGVSDGGHASEARHSWRREAKSTLRCRGFLDCTTFLALANSDGAIAWHIKW